MKKGFSIIEAIIYTAVFAVIFLVIVSLFLVHSGLFDAATALRDIQTGNLLALSTMSREIRQAVEIIPSRTMDGVPYTTSAQTLIIKLPSLDAEGDIISGAFDHTVFYLDPGNQTKLYSYTEVDASSARPDGQKLLSDFVSKIIFRYNDSSVSLSDLVDIYLETAKEARGQTREFTNSTSVKLRNK